MEFPKVDAGQFPLPESELVGYKLRNDDNDALRVEIAPTWRALRGIANAHPIRL